jgi:hypothetical protein
MDATSAASGSGGEQGALLTAALDNGVLKPPSKTILADASQAGATVAGEDSTVKPPETKTIVQDRNAARREEGKIFSEMDDAFKTANKKGGLDAALPLYDKATEEAIRVHDQAVTKLREVEALLKSEADENRKHLLEDERKVLTELVHAPGWTKANKAFEEEAWAESDQTKAPDKQDLQDKADTDLREAVRLDRSIIHDEHFVKRLKHYPGLFNRLAGELLSDPEVDAGGAASTDVDKAISDLEAATRLSMKGFDLYKNHQVAESEAALRAAIDQGDKSFKTLMGSIAGALGDIQSQSDAATETSKAAEKKLSDLATQSAPEDIAKFNKYKASSTSTEERENIVQVAKAQALNGNLNLANLIKFYNDHEALAAAEKSLDDQLKNPEWRLLDLAQKAVNDRYLIHANYADFLANNDKPDAARQELSDAFREVPPSWRRGAFTEQSQYNKPNTDLIKSLSLDISSVPKPQYTMIDWTPKNPKIVPHAGDDKIAPLVTPDQLEALRTTTSLETAKPPIDHAPPVAPVDIAKTERQESAAAGAAQLWAQAQADMKTNGIMHAQAAFDRALAAADAGAKDPEQRLKLVNELTLGIKPETSSAELFQRHQEILSLLDPMVQAANYHALYAGYLIENGQEAAAKDQLYGQNPNTANKLSDLIPAKVLHDEARLLSQASEQVRNESATDPSKNPLQTLPDGQKVSTSDYLDYQAAEVRKQLQLKLQIPLDTADFALTMQTSFATGKQAVAGSSGFIDPAAALEFTKKAAAVYGELPPGSFGVDPRIFDSQYFTRLNRIEQEATEVDNPDELRKQVKEAEAARGVALGEARDVWVSAAAVAAGLSVTLLAVEARNPAMVARAANSLGLGQKAVTTLASAVPSVFAPRQLFKLEEIGFPAIGKVPIVPVAAGAATAGTVNLASSEDESRLERFTRGAASELGTAAMISVYRGGATRSTLRTVGALAGLDAIGTVAPDAVFGDGNLKADFAQMATDGIFGVAGLRSTGRLARAFKLNEPFQEFTLEQKLKTYNYIGITAQVWPLGYGTYKAIGSELADPAADAQHRLDLEKKQPTDGPVPEPKQAASAPAYLASPPAPTVGDERGADATPASGSNLSDKLADAGSTGQLTDNRPAQPPLLPDVILASYSKPAATAISDAHLREAVTLINNNPSHLAALAADLTTATQGENWDEAKSMLQKISDQQQQRAVAMRQAIADLKIVQEDQAVSAADKARALRLASYATAQLQECQTWTDIEPFLNGVRAYREGNKSEAHRAFGKFAQNLADNPELRDTYFKSPEFSNLIGPGKAFPDGQAYMDHMLLETNPWIPSKQALVQAAAGVASVLVGVGASCFVTPALGSLAGVATWSAIAGAGAVAGAAAYGGGELAIGETPTAGGALMAAAGGLGAPFAAASLSVAALEGVGALAAPVAMEKLANPDIATNVYFTPLALPQAGSATVDPTVSPPAAPAGSPARTVPASELRT